MKKCITVFFITLFLFFSFPVYAAEYESLQGTALITTDSLNVRSGPSKDYDKMGVLKKDTMVQVIGKVEPDWYIIEYGGEEGYVHQDYVLFTPEEGKIINNKFSIEDIELKKFLPVVLVVAIVTIIIVMVITLLKFRIEEEDTDIVEEEKIPLVSHEDTNMHLGEISYDTYRLDIDPIYFENTSMIPQPEILTENNSMKELWKEETPENMEDIVNKDESIQALDFKLEEATARIVALQKEVEELKKYKG